MITTNDHSLTRICSLMVHTQSHYSEDIILNPDLFSDDIHVGDFIRIYNPDYMNNILILKVPMIPSNVSISSRLEVSLIKSIADTNNFKSFSKVVLEKINPNDVSIEFIELSFKKQYLQRGNIYRLRNNMRGRAVYVGIYIYIYIYYCIV
jgi:hypothetical protein